MLNIRINKNAALELNIATIYAETLPNRIAAARSAAMQKAKQEAKAKLPQLGRPAKYIVISVEGFGPVGATIKASPQKSYRSGKHGYDRGMGASIFLTGRRAGKIIFSQSKSFMKIRPESVNKGYPPYLVKVRMGAVRSHKDEVKRMLKEITLRNLRRGLNLQGFGPRGGVARPTLDAPAQIVG